ncbi:MAG: stage III sporulation protein AC [Clostridia bacterium]|nr:stage III sporulation protein AC [Clostridia bacterium]
MEVDLIFKIATVGIVVAVVNMILSRLGKDEYGTLTTLAGVIIVLLVLLGEIGDLFTMIQTVFDLR